jgi:hypothetical protein
VGLLGEEEQRLRQEKKRLRLLARDTRRNERKRELKKEHQAVDQNIVVDFADPEAQARLVAVLELKTGKKRLGGPIVNNFKTAQGIQEMAAIHAATKAILQNKNKKTKLSRPQKLAFKKALVRDVSFSTAKALVGCADRTMRTLRKLTQADVDELWNDEGPTITDAAGDTSAESERVDFLTMNMYAAFFSKHSGVLSGADRATRTLAIPKHKLLSILFGEFPGMLRSLVLDHPAIQNEIAPNSRLSKSIDAALAAAKQAEFDHGQEVSYRTAMAEAIYRQDLDKKRLGACKIMPAVVKPPKAEDTFSEDQITKAREIMPIGDTTFWKVLKRAKIKYTTNLKPTFCELCDSGVLHVEAGAENTRKRLANVATIAAVIATAKAECRETTPAEKLTISDCERLADKLLTESRRLGPLIRKYEQHREQYAKCRPYVAKLEEDLQPGECLLFRDFVCQYCASGQKMSNLQLVCVYRNQKGEALRQIQVSNFSLGESNDKYYVADVMDLHLREAGSGLFEKFKKITIVGDHGTHFSDIGTIFNESGMFEKYGKEVRIISLCSYHCYNRCDAAGVHSKKIAKQRAKESKPLASSKDYTMAVIDDKRTDTCAFDCNDINRSVSVFGDSLGKPVPKVNLREQCEFVYEVTGADGQPMYLKGIIKCRLVPGEGRFCVVDLVKSRQDSWCQPCTQQYQRPVAHTEGSTCKLAASSAGDPIIDMHAKQDPLRITGLQLTKKVSAAMKKTGKDAASMPVRLKCRHCKKTFSTPQGANGHMQKYHPSTYNVDRDAHVVPPKVKIPKGNRACADTTPPSGFGTTDSASVAATTASTTVASASAVVSTPVTLVNTSTAVTPTVVKSTAATATATTSGDREASTVMSRVSTEALKRKQARNDSSDKPRKKRKKKRAKQGANAESGTTPNDRVRVKRMKRKAEADIPYGPSSHQCNCDEYHSEYVHLPVAGSCTPLAARTPVWVVDFENESCRLRVIPAVVTTTGASSRGKYYEKDKSRKTKGRMLRFDMVNTVAETWWYADCDISTSRQDAECRLAAVLNRRYKAGFMEHCDIPATSVAPVSCPTKLCLQLPLPVIPLLPNLSLSMHPSPPLPLPTPPPIPSSTPTRTPPIEVGPPAI